MGDNTKEGATCQDIQCCDEVTTTTPLPTTTTVVTTTTTPCNSCIDEEGNNKSVGASWTHAKDCCLTMTCKNFGHKCEISSSKQECPESLKCNKGEFLETTADKYCLDGHCCPTEQCLPCKCCDGKEA